MHILIFKPGKTSPGVLKIHPLLLPVLYLILTAVLCGVIYTLFLARYESKRIVEFLKTQDHCEFKLNLYSSTLSAISDSIDLLEQELVEVTYKIPNESPPAENSIIDQISETHNDQLKSGDNGNLEMKYTVQVASFRRHSDAEHWQRRLDKLLNEEVMIRPVELSNGRWFRVMVGRFASDSLALEYASGLLSRSVVNQYVIQIIR